MISKNVQFNFWNLYMFNFCLKFFSYDKLRNLIMLFN